MQVKEEVQPKILQLPDVLLYDYCPAYHHFREKVFYKFLVKQIATVVKMVLGRYWLEKAADAEPTYSFLEPVIKSIFLKGGVTPSVEVLTYIEKVIAHSGRIKFDTLVMLAQTFTYKTQSGVVIQIPVDVVIKCGNQYKAIIYPNNTTNLKQNAPSEFLTLTSLFANSCFLIDEIEISVVLMVYPDKVVRVRRSELHPKSIKSRLEHVSDGIIENRLYHRTGGWCSSCSLYSKKRSLCLAIKK